jgi:cytochrome c2
MIKITSRKPRTSFFNLSLSRLFMLLIGMVMLTSCEQEEELIYSVNFEEEEFADFVEPDFPYITTSMDARNLGASFPDDNISPRVLAMRLGNEAYACFDTDMLRWSVAWTGDFLPMVTMAQISYKDFYEKKNEIPRIGGTPHFATGQYPGWTSGEPLFEDPRPANPYPDAPSWGPLDPSMARWNGHYLVGEKMVLAYEVGGVDILEMPGSQQAGEQQVFTRKLKISPSKSSLFLTLAEVRNGDAESLSPSMASLKSAEDYTTAFLGSDHDHAQIKIMEDRFLVVEVTPRDTETIVNLGVTFGADFRADEVELEIMHQEFPNVKQGSKSRWEGEVLTKGKIAPDTALFVTDQLTLPVPNPWKRNVRVVDMDFYDQRKAAIVTFEGDVWILDGITEGLDRLSWKRFASGLYEPQSLAIVDDEVYVFGKEGILRLHDLNGDGEADYYENFSNIMAQSIETREWASDMVVNPEGGFYISKFGSLDMGPETSSPKSIMGFRAGSQHGGAVLKVSADGRSLDMVASGFRGPYLGIDPKTGILSGSDQQGHHMPSTPVMLIGKGDYYGVAATAHREEIPETTPPLTWIPHAVDRSGVSQVWAHSEKMGPLNGKMVHLSYGRPGLFQVMIDSTANGMQGAVSLIHAHFPAPTMKAEMNPGDGWMYITGFALWGHASDTLSALLRLRHTGKTNVMPEKLQAREGGVMIRFGTELERERALDISNFTVKRWNYQRTEKYGSGHFRMDGEVGEEIMPIAGVEISEDAKAVFLVIPDMLKVDQMEVDYDLRAADGTAMKDQVWFTVNDLPMPNLLAEGFGEVDVDGTIADFDFTLASNEEEVLPTEALGEELFMKMGCIACHAVDRETKGKQGPTMKGLYGSVREFNDGTSMTADEDYLHESIVDPGEKVVKGYEGEMPSFLGVLSSRDLDAIVLYIMSLGEEG